MKITAYHGTLGRNVASIEKNGLRASVGGGLWFGSGVYFFETLEKVSDGFDSAKNWVINVKKSYDWAVFQADIESDSFIDLVSSKEHLELFKKVRETAKRIHNNSGKRTEQFREQVIYHKLREAVKPDMIRVLVNADAYSKYDYVCRTVVIAQIQVCVINTDCIKKAVLCARRN